MKSILRFLAFVIDILIIYFPIVLLLQVVFQLEFKTADMLSQLLYLLYAVISGSAFKGKTIGKYFSRQRIIYLNEQDSLLNAGMRELPKLLYFAPYFGFLFVIFSLLLYRWKGKTLHDWIGGSFLMMDREYKKMMTHG